MTLAGRNVDKNSIDSEEIKKQKSGLARLLQLSGEKKTMLIFSSILSAFAGIVVFVPYFVAYLIVCEFVMNAGDVSAVDKDYVYLCAIIAIVSVIINVLLVGASFILSHFSAYRILYNLRLRLAKHLSSLSLGYFNATSKGEIHKCVQDNVEKIESFVAHNIPEFTQSLIGAIALFAVFVYIDWLFGCICIAVYALSLVVQFSVYRDKGDGSIKDSIQKFYDALEAINAASIEFVRGISIVKMFGKSIFSFQDFAKSVKDYKDYTLDFALKCMPNYIIFGLLVYNFILFILPVAAIFIAKNPLDIVLVLTVLFFIMLHNGLIPPFLRLLNLSRTLMDINEGVSRMDKIFSVKPLPQSDNPKTPQNFSICFNNVNFGYGDSQNILKNINFTIKQGESLAIIGESGSGKSSILSLLARFYDVRDGSITIGGVDIRDIAESTLMEHISFVFQDSFIFLDSLRENISAGKNVSDEKVLHAAHLAQCDEIIEKFGLECKIGDDNTALSGGEAQRITIARAILKDAPIILLDEIHSALDSENAIKITKALENLKKGKTLIMVAHNLPSITHADKICLMDKGEILAIGTHTELLQTSKAYKDLWEMYNDTSQWKIHN